MYLMINKENKLCTEDGVVVDGGLDVSTAHNDLCCSIDLYIKARIPFSKLRQRPYGSSITDKSYNITFRSIAKICDELKCNYGIEQSELVDDILGKIVEIAKSQVSEEHYYPESSHHNNASIYPILSSGSVVSPTQFLLGEAGV